MHKGNFIELSAAEEKAGKLIVNAAYTNCELKALETVNPVWQAQILSHLKLKGKRLGYLINFNVPLIKDGIKRFIL